MELQLTVNGESVTVLADKTDSLLDVLRQAGYTGTNRSCDTGACGMCRVLVDGEPTESCVLPASRADGKSIETIEGLGTQDELHPIQEAFIDNSAVQCGYCTPGMVMTATAYLRENPDPTEAEVREAIDDVLCRCTGYQKIINAILEAADRMQAEPVAADGGTTPDTGSQSQSGGQS